MIIILSQFYESKKIDIELFRSITETWEWRNNLRMHTITIHTAFQTLLEQIANKIRHNIEKSESIVAIYNKICNYKYKIVNYTSKIDLIKVDNKLVTTLNEIRNNHSGTHLNNSSLLNYSSNDNLIFIEKIGNFVDELMKTFEIL